MISQNSTRESYELAVCPGCGTRLKGAREPGDRDYCHEEEREVTLKPANKNHRSHHPYTGDCPKGAAFCSEWMTTRFAVKVHREGNRVPVSFEPTLTIDPKHPMVVP